MVRVRVRVVFGLKLHGPPLNSINAICFTKSCSLDIKTSVVPADSMNSALGLCLGFWVSVGSWVRLSTMSPFLANLNPYHTTVSCIVCKSFRDDANVWLADWALDKTFAAPLGLWL